MIDNTEWAVNEYDCQIKPVKVSDVSSWICGNWNQCIAVLI